MLETEEIKTEQRAKTRYQKQNLTTESVAQRPKKTGGGGKIKKTNMTFVGIIAAMAGLLFGFDTGVISGAKEFILRTYQAESLATSGDLLSGLLVSVVPFGALLGAIISGYLAKEFGRERSLIVTALLFLIGTMSAVMSSDLFSVVLGRCMMGLGIGISAMVAPMYLGEISPPKVRGRMIFLFQLAITIGLFGAFMTNLGFAKMEDFTTNWRWMFGVGAVPAALLLVGMFYMPKSPRWLMLKGRKAEAEKAMQRILGKEDVHVEMKEMEESMKHHSGKDWSSLLKKPFFPLLVVAFLLFVFQQLSGINAVMYYGPEIFNEAGFSESSKYMAQALMGLTNVLATVLGVWIVDKVGRRPLLFVGFLGMIVCLMSLGNILRSGDVSAYVAFGNVLAYVVFFAISLGGVPYIVMSELFPLRMRSVGMAIASCANWGFNMGVSFSFKLLVNAMGDMGSVFYLYGIFTIVGLVFSYYWVPETKNRHLEEIEHNLYAGKKLRELGSSVRGH